MVEFLFFVGFVFVKEMAFRTLHQECFFFMQLNFNNLKLSS